MAKRKFAARLTKGENPESKDFRQRRGHMQEWQVRREQAEAARKARQAKKATPP